MTVYSVPQDLVPLPTMPWNTRPETLPLTVEEVRTALWLDKGNVSEAAKRLKTDPVRLRRFIRSSARLSAELAEFKEQILDRSERIVVEALEDDSDPARQDAMAKFALTNLGAERGYGKKEGRTLNINNNGGKVIVTWEGMSFDDVDDSDASGDDSKVIDHE